MRNTFLDNRAYRRSVVDESFTFQPRVMVYKTLCDPILVDVVTAVVLKTSGGVAAWLRLLSESHYSVKF